VHFHFVLARNCPEYCVVDSLRETTTDCSSGVYQMKVRRYMVVPPTAQIASSKVEVRTEEVLTHRPQARGHSRASRPLQPAQGTDKATGKRQTLLQPNQRVDVAGALVPERLGLKRWPAGAGHSQLHWMCMCSLPAAGTMYRPGYSDDAAAATRHVGKNL